MEAASAAITTAATISAMTAGCFNESPIRHNAKTACRFHDGRRPVSILHVFPQFVGPDTGHVRIFAIPPRVESLSKCVKACKMPQNRPCK